MTAFLWSPLFETGLAEVDAQHRALVALVNDLSGEADSGVPERIDATLKALADYTVYHFGSEEALMLAAGLDPVYRANHHETHQRFVEQVGTWIARRGHAGQISLRALLDYLSNWLIYHILGDDQSMGRQVAAIGRGVDAHQAYVGDTASSDPRTDILLGALRQLYADLAARNDRLVAAQAALAELNTQLEQRVCERTADLLAANERIKEEQQHLVEAEKMASLGRLVAGFAHEVNTPVGIAVGAASQSRELASELLKLLQQEEVTEAQLRERLQLLDESAALALANLQRAAGLVVSFKRTAVDQSADIARDFALREVIDDVLYNLRPLFKRSEIHITVACATDLRLHGSPGALVQILTNLCTNAHSHAFADGTRAGNIRIAARRDGDTLELCFGDDGAGMDPTSLAKAFEPFYTTRRNRGGSGLGLYLVYNLVTGRLGGRIDCRSTPGAGTEFVIRLPFHAALAEEDAA